MSINFSIKAMLFLWRYGLVDGLTMIQFLANAATQYGTIVVGSSIGNNFDPSVLAAPISGLGTSYQFVRSAQGAMEAQQRVATIAALLSTSASMTTTDLQANAAMGALHVAFSQYMQACIDASNSGNITFLLTYKASQDKIIILFIVGGAVLVLIYYYIKLLIMAARKGRGIPRSSYSRKKFAKFVRSTHQRFVVDSS